MTDHLEQPPQAEPDQAEQQPADATDDSTPSDSAEQTPAETTPSDSAEEAPAETTPSDSAEETPAETIPSDSAEQTPANATETPGPTATPAPTPTTVPVPSPAIFAKSHAAPTATAFGRADTNGVVYVKTADGEREVGSYPGASPGEALAYFARKYDELAAAVQLLHQRVTQTEMATKDAAEAVARLREQTTDARVVGDLASLDERLGEIDAAIRERRETEAAARAEAKAAATIKREELVDEAVRIAAQPEHRIQWKASGARMRELLDEWKTQQRNGPRIDKDVEAALWQRFSAARNGFDKARRAHFAQLDATHGQARSAKERLVADAERLATSKDWAATAGAFKRLMDEWRQAGRASRSDDDALWTRFKAAQDSFFAAKDAVVQAEEESYRGNLAVKEALLADAESILPVTDLDKAKAALRVIQDKWEKAGKVPRADLERTERALRRVEQAVRDAEDKRWSASNPEAAARASSFVEQLERAVAGLEKDLTAARVGGNAKKVAEAEAALAARRQWLDQARSGLQEFGGR